jgi:hypothetical protein
MLTGVSGVATLSGEKSRTMPLFMTERLKRLRQEIAEIRKENELHQKGLAADVEKERRQQRLEEILEELKFLMDSNKE